MAMLEGVSEGAAEGAMRIGLDRMAETLERIDGKMDKAMTKLDGMERRRRAMDELEDRLAEFAAAEMRALRKAVLAAVGLGAAVSLAVTMVFHFAF